MAKRAPNKRAAANTAPGRKPGAKPRRLLVWLAVVLALAGSLYLVRRPILSHAGEMLVSSDRLEKADAAVVLGGEDSLDASRVLTGVKLYRDGWVRKLVLSGPAWPYGLHETDLSLPVAVSAGVPRGDIILINHLSRSSAEEARALLPELERQGIRSIYVVTSNYHTGRARRILRKVFAGRLQVLAYPSPSDWFRPENWWQSREGRKTFFFESIKSLNSLLE